MSASFRYATLVSQLTLEEKASLCLGSDFWHTAPIERLGIPALAVADGPHGLRKQPEDGEQVGTSGSIPATCFPTASALGSSWDADLAQRIGVALGVETRVNRVSVLLGPGINMKRSPLCGRNFEYLSEDPVLAGGLGAAMVRGIQSEGVGASVKHFAANNQETDRFRVSAEVDERTLREIYFPAFEHIITQAKPWTVMCAYNKVNGTHASQHRWLLTTVLREEWGFEGLVFSDWGAVHDRPAAVAAGLDLEMPPNLGLSDAQVVAAVKAGELDERLLDAAVTRVLELVDRAVAGADAANAGANVESNAGSDAGFDLDAHHELAREAARQSAVLLKNDDDILPLTPTAGQTIAVIGEFARTPRYQGAGSSQVTPTRVDVALDELRAAVPSGVTVEFAAGFTLDGRPEQQLAAEAVRLASAADTVLVFLGLPQSAESEGFDRPDMDLPGNQLDLLAGLAAVNRRIVVVLANGSAVTVLDWQQNAAAILECWLAGQGSGRAAVDLLLGAANPSGKLAETLPVRLEDNSSYLNFPGDSGVVHYGEGIFIGYRGYDAARQPVAHPFGHGLSYTSFEYSDLTIDVQGSYAGGDLHVSVGCRITNTGARAGREIVQLYVRDVESTVARPVRELKGFTKVELAPGESSPVTFTLGSRDFSYWSILTKGWALEAGEFELAVAASSRDLRLTAVLDVEAPRIGEPLTGMSTLHEWLADPEGAQKLRAIMGTDANGVPNGVLAREELLAGIGTFPISTLAAFPGLGIDNELVEKLLS